MYIIKHIKKYWAVIFGAFVFFMFFKIAVCILILGLVFFAMGLSSILFLNKVQKHGIRCTGKILSFETDSDGDKIPVVQFIVEGSREMITKRPALYTQTDLSKLRSYGKEINKEVSILYDPDDPAQFVLAGKMPSNYVIFAVFMLAGMAALVASAGSLMGYFNIGL